VGVKVNKTLWNRIFKRNWYILNLISGAVLKNSRVRFPSALHTAGEV